VRRATSYRKYRRGIRAELFKLALKDLQNHKITMKESDKKQKTGEAVKAAPAYS